MKMTSDRKPHTLAVITGPTASGKTGVGIELAKRYQTEIVSCDSRQFYREIPIGTAAPDTEEQDGVVHHFIGSRSLTEEYSAGKYAQDTLSLLGERFLEHNLIFMVGGSGLYIDAVCSGMDAIPDVAPELRDILTLRLEAEGLGALIAELYKLDPQYYSLVDLNNPQRVIRALEVCHSTGKPYSSFRKGGSELRPFNVVKIGLTMHRDILYERINHRVDIMIQQGLEEEARSVSHLRGLNALQTVGYREMFSYFDGETDRNDAVELIKRNSRRYAKRQETWFGRDNEIHWFDSTTHPIWEISALLDGFVK